jgi:peptidoglycan/LPS O-acetylase OafA/YrhL
MATIPETAAPRQYFSSIDGLRLLASVNIVLFHLVRSGGLYEMRGRPQWLFLILRGPAFHASLFFILAGFIYTVKYAAIAESFSTKTLIKGRLRDLFPLHSVTTTAMIPFVILKCFGAACMDVPKIVFSAVIHLSMLWSVFPLYSYNYNTPSWALSAFFVCYIVFGPVLRRIVRIQRRRTVVALMVACMAPSIAWTFLYSALLPGDIYDFFHIFAPVRSFEFVMGMLLARLYYLNNARPCAKRVQDIPALNDLIIIATFACIYLTLVWRENTSAVVQWIYYHVLLIPLYALLLYRLARGNGLIARIFAFPIVRNLGKCGFYPYLIHIPLSSWICWVSANAFGYRKLLHSPLNIVIFLIVLYGGSYACWLWARTRKKKTYRPE